MCHYVVNLKIKIVEIRFVAKLINTYLLITYLFITTYLLITIYYLSTYLLIYLFP